MLNFAMLSRCLGQILRFSGKRWYTQPRNANNFAAAQVLLFVRRALTAATFTLVCSVAFAGIGFQDLIFGESTAGLVGAFLLTTGLMTVITFVFTLIADAEVFNRAEDVVNRNRRCSPPDRGNGGSGSNGDSKHVGGSGKGANFLACSSDADDAVQNVDDAGCDEEGDCKCGDDCEKRRQGNCCRGKKPFVILDFDPRTGELILKKLTVKFTSWCDEGGGLWGCMARSTA